MIRQWLWVISRPERVFVLFEIDIGRVVGVTGKVEKVEEAGWKRGIGQKEIEREGGGGDRDKKGENGEEKLRERGRVKE